MVRLCSTLSSMCGQVQMNWRSYSAFQPIHRSFSMASYACRTLTSWIRTRAAHLLEDILQKPSPGAHPVILARKLLLLAISLQGNPHELIQHLKATSPMLVDTANRLATSQDDLIASLEVVECLMTEAMFHNNARNLRRAWLTHRRAIATAQLLGLRHASPMSLPKALDPATFPRLDPSHTWSRLIITHRYLSLILDLPQASPSCILTALVPCHPLERLECLAALDILQRTHSVT